MITIPLIIAALSAVGSGVGQMWGAHKTQEHTKDVEEYEKKEKAKKLLEVQREAIARAIKQQHRQMPQAPTEPPEAPSLLGPQLLTGLSDIGSHYGAYAATKPSKYEMPGRSGVQKSGAKKRVGIFEERGIGK